MPLHKVTTHEPGLICRVSWQQEHHRDGVDLGRIRADQCVMLQDLLINMFIIYKRIIEERLVHAVLGSVQSCDYLRAFGNQRSTFANS